MKKLKSLGKSLSKAEQKKIMGGDYGGDLCNGVLVCNPEVGCGSFGCQCKKNGDAYACV